MDEPVSGIDAAFKKDIRRFLVEQLPEGAAIVMATHLLRDFEQLFDEVLFLEQDKIVQMDTEELRESSGMSVEQYFLDKIHKPKGSSQAVGNLARDTSASRRGY